MPPPVDKHTHAERHMGVVPLDQLPHWTQILESAFQVSPNSAGGNKLVDVADPDDPQDAATKAYVDGLVDAVPSGPVDMLTGDSSTLEAGIGDWDDGGGSATVTDNSDVAHAWPFVGQHNVQIEPGGVASAGGGITLAVTFKQDVRYAALFVTKSDDGYELVFGDTVVAVGASDIYQAHVVYWTPTTDTTGRVLEVRGVGGGAGQVIRVARCAIVQAQPMQDTMLAVARIPPGAASTDDSDDALTLTGNKLGNAQGPYIQYALDAIRVLAGDLLEVDFLLTGFINLWAFGGSAADESDEGLNIEVGPDGVGLRVSEKDSSTVQLYTDLDGLDAELHDRAGGGVWIIDGGGP